MSETTVTAPAPVRPRHRRRWLLLGVPLVIALAVAAFLLRPDPSEQELQDAIAEADRLDPGWRFEDLEARRKVIPDEANAALPVLAGASCCRRRGHLPPRGLPVRRRRGRSRPTSLSVSQTCRRNCCSMTHWLATSRWNWPRKSRRWSRRAS